MPDVGGVAGDHLRSLIERIERLEVWLPVLGFEGSYEVSNLGHIRSLDRRIRQRNRFGEFHRVYPGAPLTPSEMTGGYLGVTLCRGSKRQSRYLHVIVMETFVGPCPVGEEVRHKDGWKPNCRLTNLAYGTPAQNAADRIAHGTQVRGETVGTAKLTELAVREIRRSAGAPLATDSQRFGVSISTISRVRLRQTWLHVQGGQHV